LPELSIATAVYVNHSFREAFKAVLKNVVADAQELD
jgi:hypothetical protein